MLRRPRLQQESIHLWWFSKSHWSQQFRDLVLPQSAVSRFIKSLCCSGDIWLIWKQRMAFEGLNLTKLNHHLQVETGFTDAELRAIYGKLDKNRNGAGEGRIGCGVRCSWSRNELPFFEVWWVLANKIYQNVYCRWLRSIKTTIHGTVLWTTTGGSCSSVHVHADSTWKIPIPVCWELNGSSAWIWYEIWRLVICKDLSKYMKAITSCDDLS